MVCIFWLRGSQNSATTAHLCPCRVKASVDSKTEWVWLSSNKALFMDTAFLTIDILISYHVRVSWNITSVLSFFNNLKLQSHSQFVSQIKPVVREFLRGGEHHYPQHSCQMRTTDRASHAKEQGWCGLGQGPRTQAPVDTNNQVCACWGWGFGWGWVWQVHTIQWIPDFSRTHREGRNLTKLTLNNFLPWRQ